MISIKKVLLKLCPIWISDDYSNGGLQLGNLLVQWGYVNITPAGTSDIKVGTAEVIFSKEYLSKPHVQLTLANTGTSETERVATVPNSITTQGMTITGIRSSTSNVQALWLAIGKR